MIQQINHKQIQDKKIQLLECLLKDRAKKKLFLVIGEQINTRLKNILLEIDIKAKNYLEISIVLIPINKH